MRTYSAYIDEKKENGIICDEDGGIVATMGRCSTMTACYGPGVAATEDLVPCDVKEVLFDQCFDVAFMREASGLTQKAFSGIYDIPLRTLQEWENGERHPSLFVIRSLWDRVKKGSFNNIEILRDQQTPGFSKRLASFKDRYLHLKPGEHFIASTESFNFFAIKINDECGAILNADNEFVAFKVYENCFSIGSYSIGRKEFNEEQLIEDAHSIQ